MQVHPAVLLEPRVQLDAEQALLDLGQLVAAALVAEDGQLSGERDLVGPRVPDVDLALALADVGVVPVGDDGLGGVGAAAADVEHAAVGRGDQAVRFADLVVLPGPVGVGEPLRLVVAGDGRLAVGPHQTRRPQQRAAQVLAEVGLVVRRHRPAHAGVEGPSAVVVPAPADRMVPAVGALARLVRRLAHPGHGVHVAGGVLRPVQPLVGALPLDGKVLGGRMAPVADLDGGPLDLRRARRGRPGTDQPGEPVRVRLRAGRVVDAEEPAAGLHVRLQPGLLVGAEDVAAAGEEDHRVVAPEPAPVGEDRGVLRRLDPEALGGRAGLPDPLDGRDPGVHQRGLVAGCGGPVEDQDPDVGAARRRLDRHRCHGRLGRGARARGGPGEQPGGDEPGGRDGRPPSSSRAQPS